MKISKRVMSFIFAADAIGFRIGIYDAKRTSAGAQILTLDSVVNSNFMAYVTDKNYIVVYSQYEGDWYQVLRYQNGLHGSFLF